MVDLVYYLINLLRFVISLLYYYINLGLSIIFCLSSGDIYLSLSISLSCSFEPVSKLFCCEVFETLVILSAILFYCQLNHQLLLLCFELLFLKKSSMHLLQLFTMIKKFLALFTAYVFANIFTNIFSKRQRSTAL